MKHISEMKLKEAMPYKGSSFDQISKAIEILQFELHKLYLIKQALITTSQDIFDPEKHNINR